MNSLKTDVFCKFQVVFVSWCKSFWDCGLVALDDVSVSLGSCRAVGKLITYLLVKSLIIFWN